MNHLAAMDSLRDTLEERAAPTEMLGRASKLYQDWWVTGELIEHLEDARRNSYSGRWFYDLLIWVVEARYNHLGRVGERMVAETQQGKSSQ